MNQVDMCMYPAEKLAAQIVDQWVRWDSNKNEWRESRKELREYLFATSTRDTTNSKLPWKNSTVTPKLTQIRDNLHANYMAALFPREDWFTWESDDKTTKVAEKRRAITSYMRQKLQASDFDLVVSQLVYDYIDYGNVFSGYTFVAETKTDPDTGEVINLYTGPRAFRVSPLDVVMNPMADSFDKTPFFRRMLKSVGDLKDDVATKPSLGYDSAAVDKVCYMRSNYRDNPEMTKLDGLLVDGFGTLEEYLNSNMVELIEYWGDVYDYDTHTMYKDVHIVIADRKFILKNAPNNSWLGKKPFVHCGWRLRPDNLWAQGPLDQLVGMQYRIDHLENLKADVFDQIAHPMMKIKGTTVEEFQFGPGENIHCGDEGDVEAIRPDATALNADMQIMELMNRMEELAGAPKQAMGIRTPGEKTKYEVQQLENAAGRIFQSKVQWFERNVIEPILNGMLEESRRNFGGVEQIKTTDPKYKTEVFIEVTKEDLVGGQLYPMGARHFAEQAKFMQELNTTITAIQSMPSVANHISSIRVAKAIEENMGWAAWGIVQENVKITEDADTARLVNQTQEDLQVEQAVSLQEPGAVEE